MRVAGADGCRTGWVCVWIDGHTRDFGIFNDIATVAALRADLTLIYIPIGLPEGSKQIPGYRACDIAARRLLGPARSRVFLGMRRGFLKYEGDFANASQWARHDGKGISKQTFHIIPKVRQVDNFMTPQRQTSIRESHPELVFSRLNGGDVLDSKKSERGIRQRRKILLDQGFSELDSWRNRLRGSGAKEDDLLDACACAIAATNPRPVACDLQVDIKGLRMEILY